MNDELDSQLSAMFDNELPAAECELLARRLSRDPDLKARWGRYAVIGAVIRAERGVTLDGTVAGRVSAALSSEPALSADAGRGSDRGSRLQWWQPLAGVGLAAGVAAASILWLRAQALPGGGPAVAVAPAMVASTLAPAAPPPAPQGAGATRPDSFVVPPVSQRPMVVPATELADYVVAHSAFSWPFTRGSLLSALMVSEPGTSSTPVGSVQPAAGVQGNAIQNPK
ncbi:MAG: sigma-E factor negative regulatory protein [Proteobacteria bacterium]|nr:sigma-E factor negative regulatory protein [Pseudomonadota bacterium]